MKAPTIKENSLYLWDRSGTYVVILHAEKPGVVRLGRLGTFWFPAGYLLYVGSAFGGGGVASRTERHLGKTGPLRWNIDYLRGFASSVELWWTHHPNKVECNWAMALSGMPECCCTAPQAGANDCKSRPAHLFSTKERPSIKAFAKQLGTCGSGGYTVHCQAASHALIQTKVAKLKSPKNGDSDPFNSGW
jgi:Uri superfamily endonuclease